MRRLANHLSLAALLFCPVAVSAADVQVIALTNGKATVIVDNGRARTLSSGQSTPEGVRLVSATTQSAVFEIDGQRRTLGLGTSYKTESTSQATHAGGNAAVIAADSQGHFMVTGIINNAASVRFMVDTGATVVSISESDATRAGINYLSGQRAVSRTASGVTPVYRVKLDTIKIGEITLYNVDAAVHVGDGLPIGLLGMSFLNRTEMKRDAGMLTLTRRY
jgi:aspartyl protease family protein